MPLYELDPAKLGELEGQGYAFSRKTVWGKTYQGIFYGDEETLQDLKEEDEIVYAGKVYLQSRISELEKEVKITDLTPTRNGLRAAFEAVGNPDQV